MAPKFGTGDLSLFASKRVGAVAKVIDPALLSQIAGLLQSDGIVQGSEHFSATKNETDVYNGLRETSAKSAGKEWTGPISIARMAQRNAAHEAGTIRQYIEQIVDTIIPDQSFSLRFVNQGTEDHPKVLWAYVLVPKRAARAK